MLEADMGVTDLAMQSSSGRYRGDETLLVKFYTHPRLSGPKTQEAGRPIYEEVPYIEIIQPGNKDSIVRRPATARDKSRFAEHYRKFEARVDQDTVEGTPLEEWPMVTRSQVEELRFFNIRTVEQLASASDSNLSGMMGVAMLRQKANEYLERAESTATAKQLAELQKKYDNLLARMDAEEEAEA